MREEIAWLRNLKPGAVAAGREADVIPNGSFAEGTGDLPLDWELIVGEVGASTQWLASGGADGKPCLRISPRGGGAAWRSAAITVTGGAEYLFRCAMKRDGHRHWPHACEASGVYLAFHDAAGTLCESPSTFVKVRCRKTDGWVEGWRDLRAPDTAVTLTIVFRIERGIPSFDDPYGFRRFWHGEIDTGDWWIGDVRLERLPLRVAPVKGCLAIRIPPGGARIQVTNDRGEHFHPPGAATYQWGGGCFHVLRDEVQLALEPGAYVIEAMQGFQRKLFKRSVSLAEGAKTSVEIELPRVIDLPAQGWYDGDHHNHLSFHGETRHPLMSIDDVCRMARGEGLNYLSFCGELVDQHAYADWRDAGRAPADRPDGAIEMADFLCSVSHEVTQDLLGHICLVNAPGHVQPGHPWWIAPTNAAIIEQVRKGDRCRTHGAVVMAHPYDSLTSENLFEVLADPAQTCLHRELPVDVALGLADTMDFLAVEAPADLALRFRDYFRLLNLGLRIGVSGASDVYADQGTEIIGSLRTLAHAEAFTLNAIVDAYRAQRTVATNGPVLMFSVNGADVGGIVPGPVARVSAKAFSLWGLTKLEVIAGGEVVAEAAPDAGGWAVVEQEVVCDSSQWMIARAYGPGHANLNMQCVHGSQQALQGQWAVTSPIYVEVPGRPLISKREDVEYFIRWIDASCQAIRARRDFLERQGPFGPVMSETHVAAALKLFARGRAFYEQLGAQGFRAS